MNTKRRLFWLGLFLLVSSWQFLAPLLTPPVWIGAPLALLGGVVIGVSLSEAVPPLGRGALLCYALAALVVGALAPYPYCLGCVPLLAGVVIIWAGSSSWKRLGFGFGLVLAGVIFFLQSLALPVLMSIGALCHNLAVVAPVFGALLRFFGYHAYVEGSTVFVQTDRGIQEFAVSAEYFSWLFLVNAVLGVLVWQALGPFKNRLRCVLGFAVAALIYALGRYLLLAVVYLDLRTFPLFWNPWLVCLSFLPLFLWLYRFSNKPEHAPHRLEGSGEWPKFRLRTLGAASIAAALALVVGAWGWEDPGRPKAGRMLIDEAHSDWELMNRKYDTEWFGEESGYNYYCLAEWLGHYYRVRKSGEKITPALLADCDVLLLKTPTRAFTTEEIDAIEAFVARGGGLLLIGDHTNVFGTSTYLNPIARRFGLHYNFDATYDLPTGGLSLFKKPRLAPHPIVQWLPPFLFGTSCTLDVPWSAALPINGYGLRVAGHDYSTPSFFTSKTDGPQVGFGLFPQLAAVKFKRGRVAAFTDSTVFSNFWMFIPGKPELMLGCTEWINRENRGSAPAFLLCLAGLVLGLGGLLCVRKPLRGVFPLVFVAGCCGFFAGAHGTSALNRRYYPPPRPHTPYRTICFDSQYSRFELPTETLIHEPKLEFDTLYTCVQRAGCVPCVSVRLEDGLAHGNGVILINPSGRTSDLERRRLKEYVQRGGLLILLVSATNQQSSAKEILAGFELDIDTAGVQKTPILNQGGEIVALARQTGLAVGGEGLLFTDKRQPVLSSKREGKGVIIVSADAELFSNAGLGTSNILPDETQKRLYRILFEILRQVESRTPPVEAPRPVPDSPSTSRFTL